MEWTKPALVVFLRLVGGLPLAAVLASLGMAVASALSVFFGISGLSTLLIWLMIGAGIGGGLGAGVLMFRVDAIPSWPLLLVIALALPLIGAAGAWAGFGLGGAITAYQDSQCLGVCEYLFRPKTYMALGATIVANLVSLVFNVGYEIRAGDWAKPGLLSAGAPVRASGDTGPRI